MNACVCVCVWSNANGRVNNNEERFVVCGVLLGDGREGCVLFVVCEEERNGQDLEFFKGLGLLVFG